MEVTGSSPVPPTTETMAGRIRSAMVFLYPVAPRERAEAAIRKPANSALVKALQVFSGDICSLDKSFEPTIMDTIEHRQRADQDE